jgi:hypothetical protein
LHVTSFKNIMNTKTRIKAAQKSQQFPAFERTWWWSTRP